MFSCIAFVTNNSIIIIILIQQCSVIKTFGLKIHTPPPSQPPPPPKKMEFNPSKPEKSQCPPNPCI